MKSFREYLTEANPNVDKQYRDEALRVFNRMVAAFEKLVRAKSTDHMEIEKNGSYTELAVNVGKLLNDRQYSGLYVIFSNATRDYNGAYGNDFSKAVIYLAIMSGRKTRDPSYKLTNTPSDDYNGWIYSGAFLPTKDVSNYEHLLQTIKTKKEHVKDIFVHEFIHHADTFRYKDRKYVTVASYDRQTGYGKEYFNHPKEVNAHTQEMIQNIDEWFKAYYLSAVHTLKATLGKKFNSASNHDQFEDAYFFAEKLVRHYDTINEYLTDKKGAIKSIRDKIPSGKQNFAKHLTQDNTKKVLVRLYQYYDEVLSKRFRLLKTTLENVASKLNNQEASLYIKQEDVKVYNALRKMGMR